MAALLIMGGVAAGMLASSATTASLAWRAPPRFPTTEQVASEPIDQGNAGRSWARTAFEGGLRRCPAMNAEFLAACEAEMKALQERPKLAYGSSGGPLLITKVVPEQPTEPYRPEQLELEPAMPEEPTEPVPAIAPVEAPTPINYPAAEPPAQ
ncbi:hypothetical protein [Sphingomonas sp. ID1715]|uniref:hypothetical protein n=1 Tax=Sphingomonas sp. ID1715 TaxID=1656898 RepID=UPI001C2C011C|nr:hypothetical protein [Sphingomonas sp. ID1715]